MRNRTIRFKLTVYCSRDRLTDLRSTWGGGVTTARCRTRTWKLELCPSWWLPFFIPQNRQNWIRTGVVTTYLFRIFKFSLYLPPTSIALSSCCDSQKAKCSSYIYGFEPLICMQPNNSAFLAQSCWWQRCSHAATNQLKELDLTFIKETFQCP
jgi:hypothetical protein